jgi:hypothetical protein
MEAGTQGLRIHEMEQDETGLTFFRSVQKHPATLMQVQIYPSSCQRSDFKVNVLNAAKYKVKS